MFPALVYKAYSDTYNKTLGYQSRVVKERVVLEEFKLTRLSRNT